VNKISSIIEIWQSAQQEIKNQIGLATYETWFSPIVAKVRDGDVLTLEMPDEFFKDWVVDHYLKLIQKALGNTSAKSVQIKFDINPKIAEKITSTGLAPDNVSVASKNKPQQSTSLNPRFSFDSFVVGPSNRFAHAASLAIVESPAKAYNPFFIWGGVGLGKTHLMQAIAHELTRKNHNIKVCYITSERFTNELIGAIQHRLTSNFRKKYRAIDVILIDDIHFIAGKESTQEEFFHTFNDLYDRHKQIIISSDRPPKEIAKLEERLVSRFHWGLITDIQPPDFETRVAILKKKIEREPVDVAEDVIFYIAQQITANIRELEGALIRVVAYSLLEEKPISLDMAKEVLGNMVSESQKNITVDLIQRRVADRFNLSLQDLRTKKRNKNIVLPRQIAMYLARELTNFSLPEIGVFFGGKDHTTILHAWKKIKHIRNDDTALNNAINSLITELKH